MDIAGSEEIGHAFDTLLGTSVNGSEGLRYSQSYMAGVLMAGDYLPASVTGQESLFSSVGKGLKAVWDWIVKTLKSIWNFLTGKKSKTTKADIEASINKALDDVTEEDRKRSATLGKRYAGLVSESLFKYAHVEKTILDLEGSVKYEDSPFKNRLEHSTKVIKSVITMYVDNQKTNLKGIEKNVALFESGNISLKTLDDYSKILEDAFDIVPNVALSNLKKLKSSVDPMMGELSKLDNVRKGENLTSDEKTSFDQLRHVTLSLVNLITAVEVMESKFNTIVKEEAKKMEALAAKQ